MPKKKTKKNKKKYKTPLLKEKKPSHFFILPRATQKHILGVVTLLLAIIITLSFFGKAGIAGRATMEALTFLIGKAVFAVPLILVLAALVFFTTRYQRVLGGVLLAILLLAFGTSGIISTLYHPETAADKPGGWLGYLMTYPLLKFFGLWVTQIITIGIIIIGGLIFWYLLRQPKAEVKETRQLAGEKKKPSLIKKIFTPPRFEVKGVEPVTKDYNLPATRTPPAELELELKTKEIPKKAALAQYQMPPLDLLASDKEKPTAGDTRINSVIIKKTLENFSIPVEMSEVNIGPTVTQYSLKPAEGIKLSKITTLSNDLSLALAAHPIRIEAPIPGKSLVGIEVPNKERAKVRLKDLIADYQFQNALSNLVFCLGRNVSGRPVYADLAKMPHLLVAGSTGTGKTIFLNSLILSLLYHNGPATLRFILIDPKRVEFTVYQGLPHLLCPVIFDPQRTINALKWLISEMERRFNVLSEEKFRDINGYNEVALRNGEELLPYIVLIVDELADLMAARGRDMEAGIVRLAQMARAVGIHLVLATQRPSVEVITGLIKANVTSRVTFQVASQVDSRTVLDMAGAEKLLGLGDMLYISAETVKPRRIQGAYISEKEVRKVVDYIRDQVLKIPEVAEKIEEGVLENHLAQDLKKILEGEPEEGGFESFYDTGEGEDPLYEEAKRVVIEARKASASLLQRRLRIGYARAARLIDMLEEKGIVGPGEGAKPREILFKSEENSSVDDDWERV